MDKIVGNTDMDAFQIGKMYFCKELGAPKVGKDEAQSFFFDIGLRWKDLSKKEKITCSYVLKKIHRLPSGVTNGTRTLPIASLGKIVADFNHSVTKSAYEGGHYERDLLDLLKNTLRQSEELQLPKSRSSI